jgi:clan AA aspartic protease
MGLVRVPVKLFAPSNGHEPVELDALVDTGAIYSLFPRDVLERLDVKPTGHGQFRTIDGNPIERDVGAVEMEVEGRRSLTLVPVIFGDSADRAVLGATALEIMGLEVDPARGELRPTDLLLLTLLPREEE